MADNSLRLEFAVVEERLQRLVPSDTLVNVVMNSKTLISRRLGGKVIGVKSKFQSTTEMPVKPSKSAAINPLSPGIKLQILLLCFHTFLTEVVGRSC